MKTKRKQLIIYNLFAFVLFIIPAFKLDLFNENYSTLSLTTRGYLYLLFEGIIIGLILGYETRKISNNYCAIIMFLSLLIGVIIPHHVPYNFQGNMHLLFAYIGFVGLVICTIINCKIKKYRDIYLLFIFASIIIYLKFGMVNTLSEIIVMFSSLSINYLLFNRYAKQ